MILSATRANLSCPWLWYHVTPAIPIIFAFFYIQTFSSFIHAATTDPGVGKMVYLSKIVEQSCVEDIPVLILR